MTDPDISNTGISNTGISNPGISRPDKPLAHQATEIYDSHGEQAMLDFIAPRMAPRPPEARADHALIVLQDHTCIQSTDFLYNFLWIDPEAYGERTISRDRLRNRPARIPAAQRPQAP